MKLRAVCSFVYQFRSAVSIRGQNGLLRPQRLEMEGAVWLGKDEAAYLKSWTGTGFEDLR
jgi:hypothetical protein